MQSKIFILVLIFFCFCFVSFSQEKKPKRSVGQIARDLKNPVSVHYTVPFQNNFEVGDVDDQFRYDLDIEPVIPFVAGDKWKIITRTIVSFVINQFNGIKGDGPSDLDDLNLTGLLAPQRKVNGITWGFGFSMDIPTATEPELGNQKWTAGPSALFLKESRNWTYGLLLNQAWSYAGNGSQNINYLFADGWVSHTWENGFGATIESESLFDWINDEQTIPVRFGVNQVFIFGNQPVAFNIDGLFYPVRPVYEAKWGGSLTITLVFEHSSYR